MRKVLLALFGFVAALQAEERPLGLTSLTQELTAVPLVTKGEIPGWLNGTFVRNGPALFNVGQTYVKNWFDGLAMLHGFRFDNGKVIYTNKFLRTTPYDIMVKQHSLNFAGFAQAEKGAKVGESIYIPNANINVAKFDNQYVALTEVPLPVLFDLQTLDTKGLFTYTDYLPQKGIWECAHPHFDPETGEWINYYVKFGKESSYCLYSMKKDSKTRLLIAELEVEEPSYMHSFAVTKNYIILTEFPFVGEPKKMDAGFISAFHWVENRPMYILLINRKTGDLVRQYSSEGIFAFHHINSYEEEGQIVMDIAAYPDASVITNVDGQDPENRRVARFTRYFLSLSSSKVAKLQLGEAIEMPRINYDRYNAKPYQYVYGIDDRDKKKCTLIKIDAVTKQLTTWSEDGCFASEPVFVPSPNSKKEDDGILLSVVLDTKAKNSFLLILKASSMKELGRAIVPHHIPYGFHGEYFTKSS